MSQGPPPGQYPYPPPARSWSAADVFGRTLLGGVAFFFLTGLISGTIGLPIFGTIIGAVAGFAIGIPVALAMATVVTSTARPSVGLKTFRLSVDLVLLVVVIAAIALAIVWNAQHALVGPRPIIAMLVIVVLGAIGARPLLRRFKPQGA